MEKEMKLRSTASRAARSGSNSLAPSESLSSRVASARSVRPESSARRPTVVQGRARQVGAIDSARLEYKPDGEEKDVVTVHEVATEAGGWMTILLSALPLGRLLLLFPDSRIRR